MQQDVELEERITDAVASSWSSLKEEEGKLRMSLDISSDILKFWDSPQLRQVGNHGLSAWPSEVSRIVVDLANLAVSEEKLERGLQLFESLQSIELTNLYPVPGNARVLVVACVILANIENRPLPSLSQLSAYVTARYRLFRMGLNMWARTLIVLDAWMQLPRQDDIVRIDDRELPAETFLKPCKVPKIPEFDPISINQRISGHNSDAVYTQSDYDIPSTTLARSAPPRNQTSSFAHQSSNVLRRAPSVQDTRDLVLSPKRYHIARPAAYLQHSWNPLYPTAAHRAGYNKLFDSVCGPRTVRNDGTGQDKEYAMQSRPRHKQVSTLSKRGPAHLSVPVRPLKRSNLRNVKSLRASEQKTFDGYMNPYSPLPRHFPLGNFDDDDEDFYGGPLPGENSQVNQRRSPSVFVPAPKGITKHHPNPRVSPSVFVPAPEETGNRELNRRVSPSVFVPAPEGLMQPIQMMQEATIRKPGRFEESRAPLTESPSIFVPMPTTRLDPNPFRNTSSNVISPIVTEPIDAGNPMEEEVIDNGQEMDSVQEPNLRRRRSSYKPENAKTPRFSLHGDMPNPFLTDVTEKESDFGPLESDNPFVPKQVPGTEVPSSLKSTDGGDKPKKRVSFADDEGHELENVLEMKSNVTENDKFDFDDDDDGSDTEYADHTDSDWVSTDDDFDSEDSVEFVFGVDESASRVVFAHETDSDTRLSYGASSGYTTDSRRTDESSSGYTTDGRRTDETVCEYTTDTRRPDSASSGHFTDDHKTDEYESDSSLPVVKMDDVTDDVVSSNPPTPGDDNAVSEPTEREDESPDNSVPLPEKEEDIIEETKNEDQEKREAKEEEQNKKGLTKRQLSLLGKNRVTKSKDTAIPSISPRMANMQRRGAVPHRSPRAAGLRVSPRGFKSASSTWAAPGTTFDKLIASAVAIAAPHLTMDGKEQYDQSLRAALTVAAGGDIESGVQAAIVLAPTTMNEEEEKKLEGALRAAAQEAGKSAPPPLRSRRPPGTDAPYVADKGKTSAAKKPTTTTRNRKPKTSTKKETEAKGVSFAAGTKSGNVAKQKGKSSVGPARRTSKVGEPKRGTLKPGPAKRVPAKQTRRRGMVARIAELKNMADDAEKSKAPPSARALRAARRNGKAV